jgi:hypothetical protein
MSGPSEKKKGWMSFINGVRLWGEAAQQAAI